MNFENNLIWFFMIAQEIGSTQITKTLPSTPGQKTGGHSLIWPIRVCAAEQGMVFKVLSLLNRVYNFTIKCREQGEVFLDWKPFKECEDLR